MAHMHASVTFILMLVITCSAAGLLKDLHKGGLSSSHWHHNPFLHRYFNKLANGFRSQDYNLGKMENSLGGYRMYASNYPTDVSIWQLFQRFYYPSLHYRAIDDSQGNRLRPLTKNMQQQVGPNFGVNYNNYNSYTISPGSLRAKYPAGYNQPYHLGSMSERTQRPMELNFKRNFIPSTMNQISTRGYYPGAYNREGIYNQRNHIQLMSQRTKRPTIWNFAGNYINPIPSTMSHVSPRENYHRNALGPMPGSERRQVGWNFGGNYNDPILFTMSNISPRSNYPTVPGSRQRPVGWIFRGIVLNPIYSPTRPDYSEDRSADDSEGGKPFDTISRHFPHPVGWPFGGIYKSYGEHIFHFPVRYYGHTLGSSLVLAYRFLYPKSPAANFITHNLHYNTGLDCSVIPCPIQSPIGTESHGVISPLIKGGQGLGFHDGQSVSPVSHKNNPLTTCGGLGFRSPQENSGAHYLHASSPAIHSYALIQPIILYLGNLNSGNNEHFPVPTSVNHNIQNMPNARNAGESNLKGGLDFSGHGNYPTGDYFNIITGEIDRTIGSNMLSPSYRTIYPVSQSVNHGSYVTPDSLAYQRLATRGRFDGYESFNPTNYPTGHFDQYTKSPDSYTRLHFGGLIERYSIQLPLSVIYIYPKPEIYEARGYDS